MGTVPLALALSGQTLTALVAAAARDACDEIPGISGSDFLLAGTLAEFSVCEKINAAPERLRLA
jgi:hypothetical protein